MTDITLARAGERAAGEMRPITLTPGVMKNAAGSCLAEFGDTRVLCSASVEEGVPGWRKNAHAGWVTAEYAMLPAAGNRRTPREYRGRKGRSMEIERLIGRSLRAVTRMGLVDAGKLPRLPLTGQVAAVSAGIVDGRALLDLDYPEDSHAEVDLNLVGTGDGRIVEVQGTGERSTLDRAQLDALLDLCQGGIARLAELQADVTGYRP